VGVNVAVFLAMALAGAGVVNLNPEVHVRWGSNFGLRTLDGEWWRLGTSMFVHFGILHLLLNMWVLRLYGALAERLFGSAHFLALYLLSGIAASLTSLWWHPEVNSAGASGAIFGMFGGLLAFVVQRKNRVPVSLMTAHRNSMLAFIGYNLLFGFIYPGIDNAAHLGGLLSGFLLGLGLARPVDAGYRRQHGVTRLIGVVLVTCLLLVLAGFRLERTNASRVGEQRSRDDVAWIEVPETGNPSVLRLHELRVSFGGR
jgi:rhomboid protease GluP